MRLIIFARYPVPGKAKTRLIPELGEGGAASLHRRLTENIAATARFARELADFPLEVEVSCHGGSPRDFRAWLGNHLRIVRQPPGGLGEKMAAVSAAAFAGGVGKVLLVGADVPGISPELLVRAAAALDSHDVVLGPAADGGYYLIGMNRPLPSLFEGVEWGTEVVAEQTRGRIAAAGLTCLELPALADIDRPEDLAAIRGDSRFAAAFDPEPVISVVIPTLNEEKTLTATIGRVNRGGGGVEIIVADGGSVDNTRSLAIELGARVVTASGGRGVQLNAGAAAAAGGILLFLHADTLLADAYAAAVRRTLANPAVAAGAFRFQTDGRGFGMWLVELITNFRSRWLRTPYGDQGIFLEKRIFDELGGFAEIPIMEDFEFVRRLRRRGRLITIEPPATTSARRWRRLGVVRNTIRNQIMIAGFLLGVPPARLAKLYRKPILQNSPP